MPTYALCMPRLAGRPAPRTYGLRVRPIGPSLAISGLTAGVTKMPVRNPSFRLPPAANDDLHDAAICGFHMGCGLIIRRLKKKGPKNGPGKGPTRQSDNVRCRSAGGRHQPPRHLHDRLAIVDHKRHCLIPLLHDTQLHQHWRSVKHQPKPP